MGFPHNEDTLRRFALLLQLCYAYGGERIYVESALFQTNANDRNDWEESFCSGARNVLRNFYRMTCAEERKGRPQVNLALIYGNLESMFWPHDDRSPELIDVEDWDRLVWGKWRESNYRWMWKAAEAWLPPVDFADRGKNTSLVKMFSGTPCGPVDVVSPMADLNSYRAIAFLGWNTMTQEIYDRLLAYVRQGGIVFLCGCHLNTRNDLRKQPDLINGGKVSDLIGADIAGAGKMIGGVRSCKLENITSRQVDSLLYVNSLGKGKVYFLSYFDYASNPGDTALPREVLERIGSEICESDDVRIKTKKRGIINYNIWADGPNRWVYLANVDWDNPGTSAVTIHYKSQSVSTRIRGGQMQVIEFLKNRAPLARELARW